MYRRVHDGHHLLALFRFECDPAALRETCIACKEADEFVTKHSGRRLVEIVHVGKARAPSVRTDAEGRRMQRPTRCQLCRGRIRSIDAVVELLCQNMPVDGTVERNPMRIVEDSGSCTGHQVNCAFA